MPPNTIRIHVQASAPDKPALGDACNGCGVCCQWRPCPMGVLVSRRLAGPCAALHWDDVRHLYRCGMVDQPSEHWPALPALALRALSALAKRWIAAGKGCDSSLVVDKDTAWVDAQDACQPRITSTQKK